MKLEVINKHGEHVLVGGFELMTNRVRESQDDELVLSQTSLAVAADLTDDLASLVGFLGASAQSDAADSIVVCGLAVLLTAAERAELDPRLDEDGVLVDICTLKMCVKDNALVITIVDNNGEEQPEWSVPHALYQSLLSHVIDVGLITR